MGHRVKSLAMLCDGLREGTRPLDQVPLPQPVSDDDPHEVHRERQDQEHEAEVDQESGEGAGVHEVEPLEERGESDEPCDRDSAEQGKTQKFK
jgi:hypothetical protein